MASMHVGEALVSGVPVVQDVRMYVNGSQCLSTAPKPPVFTASTFVTQFAGLGKHVKKNKHEHNDAEQDERAPSNKMKRLMLWQLTLMIRAEIGNTAKAGQLLHALVSGRLIKCFVPSPVEGEKLCFVPCGSMRH